MKSKKLILFAVAIVVLGLLVTINVQIGCLKKSVSLTVHEDSISSHSVEIEMKNISNKVVCLENTDLLVKKGNAWEMVEAKEGIITIAPAIGFKTSKIWTLQFDTKYGELPPGYYKIVQNYFFNDIHIGHMFLEGKCECEFEIA